MFLIKIWVISKLKLPNWLSNCLSFSLLVSLIIICLIPTIPMFILSNEPELTNQALCSMNLDNQSTQPKSEDHPITASPASTDLTNTQPKQ
uniref:F-ORF n=1 Tax=Cuneopsis celtiformis TaxID=340328 RepID=UPI001BEEB124|nr:F-ORF [Cuneopsis celtiformis]QUA05839.1 F-ORF [Cuneopsis celtiformis]